MWKQTLLDTSKAMNLIKLEEKYPEFYKRWERMKDRILNYPYLERKDDAALAIYCALFVEYTVQLRWKGDMRHRQLEGYIFLLILIQTSLKKKYHMFDEMELIRKVDEDEPDAITENNLLQVVEDFNDKIRGNFWYSEERLENLIEEAHKKELQTFCNTVTNIEKQIMDEINELFRGCEELVLEKIYKTLNLLFNTYSDALTEMRKKHKELNEKERRKANSSQNLCELAKKLYIEESKVFVQTGGEKVIYVIFENSTVVGVLEEGQNIEESTDYAKKRLIESKDEGYVQRMDGSHDSDERRMSFLYQSQEFGCMNGIWNHYWEDEDDYFYNDEMIAREFREKDIEELQVRYIISAGKVIFDSKE